MISTPIILIQKRATAEWLHDMQKEIVFENSGAEKDSERLMIALRLGLAAWALQEASESQLLEIVDKYKTSPNN